MRKFAAFLFNGRLQVTLTTSFILLAVITIGVGGVVISRLINEYLASAADERVARDMDLAKAFYQMKLDEVAGISHRLSLDAQVKDQLTDAISGQAAALDQIDAQITNKITVMALGGTHLIAVLDAQGTLVSGRVLYSDGNLSPKLAGGSWRGLPILDIVLATDQPQTATEIISSTYLQHVGLAEQAKVALIQTPKASPTLFDPSEGTAGLTLAGIYPIHNPQGQMIGAVLTLYLFNNDFILVDRIKELAGVDTATIFFGDMRVSTNVHNLDGSRAVGTRVSQVVYDTVLLDGIDYKGEAFVVNEWYITQYTPLRDHQGNVVGSLYVGANRNTFDRLVSDFNKRVALISLICIMFAGIMAYPITRRIVRPISELVEANQKLAAGDMAVQVQPKGSGEIAVLGHSFNTMVQTLHQTQQELLHKERLASVGQLAAGVAHEINNPLGTILLFSNMLYKETRPESPQSHDLEMIIKETNRCKTIVADLLNFSRQQEIFAQEVDIHRLITDVVDTLSLKPGFEQVEFVFDFEPEIPLIQADANQLEQVFINLLNNAAEAMPAGGTITIASHLMRNAKIEIHVRDTGQGIAAEDIPKLFLPFFTTKQLGKGTGLGLSIVYGIVKMHQGQIAVQSQLGTGTTFVLQLPIQQPQITQKG